MKSYDQHLYRKEQFRHSNREVHLNDDTQLHLQPKDTKDGQLASKIQGRLWIRHRDSLKRRQPSTDLGLLVSKTMSQSISAVVSNVVWDTYYVANSEQ